MQEKLDALALRVRKSRELLGMEAARNEGKSHPVTLVIRADPGRPPHSARVLVRLLTSTQRRIRVTSHCHSSVSKLDPALKSFLDDCCVFKNPDVTVTLIWKKPNGGLQEDLPSLTVGGETSICGEAQVARYLARMVLVVRYDEAVVAAEEAARHDAVIDLVSGLDEGGSSEALEQVLADDKRRKWLSSSLGGILLWSWHKRQQRRTQQLGPNVKKWLKEYASSDLVAGLL